jgi:hypothetical protein
MMSENPENRMPLSQPARSVAAAPAAADFGTPLPARRDSARARPAFAEPCFDDPAVEADDFGERDERSDFAADVFAASAFGDAGFAAAVFGDADGAPADFAVADFAVADLAASDVAGSTFEPRGDALGRPGTAGRRGTPDDRGGRGASGCIAPPHRPGKENGGGPTATPVTKSKPFRP